MNGDPVNKTGETNAGGWPASEMRKYLNDLDVNDDEDGVIYNLLPESLREGIIDTYVVSSHGSGDITGELENDNFGSTDKLYLLSTYEVWGSNPGSDSAAIDTITRQLDYYANYKGVDSSGAEYTGVSTTNYAGAIKTNSSGSARWWWLRSANSGSSNIFYYVRPSGEWSYGTSCNGDGVSPAFRLAE